MNQDKESPYRIFGSELSPYSVKVRSWFRYKMIAHRWYLRNGENRDEYQRYARLPLVPLVITPDSQGLQDSTPIIETLEALYPDPEIHPTEPVSQFISYLLEEFADEWGNKWMFHYRWARPVDQASAAGRIARSMDPEADEQAFSATRNQVMERMVQRLWFVGSNMHTGPQIERSFLEVLQQLDRHLATRHYLFGGRPAFADFALWAQIYECWTDPTAGSLIEGRTPELLNWIHRMLWPTVNGEFETWSSLETTLAPLLRTQLGARFLPWTQANARAVHAGDEQFTVTLDTGEWSQRPQKYHARSYLRLIDRFGAYAGNPELAEALASVDCLGPLSTGAQEPS